MGKAENQVETYLEDQVKVRGGFTRKWVSPGHVGVPDRICFLPGGLIIFVEVKAPGGVLSGPQFREMTRITNIGANAWVVVGKTGVDDLMNYFVNRIVH